MGVFRKENAAAQLSREPQQQGNALLWAAAMPLRPIALAFFGVFFLFVTVAGFWAARWRRPAAGMHSLEEWGLAGRSFGTWITWFLIGGDLYTAYTIIAVSAALYGGGAAGVFRLPYP